MKSQKSPDSQTHCLPIYMCLGLSVGTAIGSATGNLAICMPIGLSIGMCIGTPSADGKAGFENRRIFF